MTPDSLNLNNVDSLHHIAGLTETHNTIDKEKQKKKKPKKNRPSKVDEDTQLEDQLQSGPAIIDDGDHIDFIA